MQMQRAHECDPMATDTPTSFKDYLIRCENSTTAKYAGELNCNQLGWSFFDRKDDIFAQGGTEGFDNLAKGKILALEGQDSTNQFCHSKLCIYWHFFLVYYLGVKETFPVKGVAKLEFSGG